MSPAYQLILRLFSCISLVQALQRGMAAHTHSHDGTACIVNHGLLCLLMCCSFFGDVSGNVSHEQENVVYESAAAIPSYMIVYKLN